MLIKYAEWLKMHESSPMTRQRLGWGRMGTYPLRADFMSHSTPPPDIMNKMIKLEADKISAEKELKTRQTELSQIQNIQQQIGRAHV